LCLIRNKILSRDTTCNFATPVVMSSKNTTPLSYADNPIVENIAGNSSNITADFTPPPYIPENSKTPPPYQALCAPEHLFCVHDQRFSQKIKRITVNSEAQNSIRATLYTKPGHLQFVNSAHSVDKSFKGWGIHTKNVLSSRTKKKMYVQEVEVVPTSQPIQDKVAQVATPIPHAIPLIEKTTEAVLVTTHDLSSEKSPSTSLYEDSVQNEIDNEADCVSIVSKRYEVSIVSNEGTRERNRIHKEIMKKWRQMERDLTLKCKTSIDNNATPQANHVTILTTELEKLKDKQVDTENPFIHKSINVEEFQQRINKGKEATFNIPMSISLDVSVFPNLDTPLQVHKHEILPDQIQYLNQLLEELGQAYASTNPNMASNLEVFAEPAKNFMNMYMESNWARTATKSRSMEHWIEKKYVNIHGQKKTAIKVANDINMEVDNENRKKHGKNQVSAKNTIPNFPQWLHPPEFHHPLTWIYLNLSRILTK
jgi:hypothetical protein